MSPRHFIPAILFSLALIIPANADTAKGIEAMRNKSYKQAFEEFSKQETVLDKFYTGWFIYFTDISQQPSSKGLQLLLQAAEQNCAPAQFYLGRIHRLGLRQPTETQQAIGWLEQAQAQGYLKARLELKAAAQDQAPLFASRPDTATSSYDIAKMYEDGIGVDKDIDKAVSFYEQAARAGSTRAMHKLALLTIEGQIDGIPDMISAHLWMQEATQSRNPTNLSFAQLRKQYIRGLQEAAQSGNVQAQISLANSYLKAIGVNQDNAKAFKWYSTAASKNNAIAQNNLGMLYLQGKGTEQNDKLALSYFKKAAQQENASAQNNLARMLETGRGTKKDIKQALSWYTKAANHGFAKAQYSLARLYRQEAPGKTFYWCQRAARQGQINAQLSLAGFYLNGEGTEKNLYKAYVWTAVAAKAGNPKAKDAKDKLAALLTPESLKRADENAQNWRPHQEITAANQ